MAILDFNANDVEPADDFTALPVGEYTVMITESEIKETKNNPGNKYMKLTIDVIDGKYKGRKIFENLNLWRAGNTDKDQTTTKIAQQKLSALCRAVGNMHIKDSSELHNKPIIVKLKIRAASGDYGESNEITAYKSINGGNTLPQQQTAAPTAPKAPTAEKPAGKYQWDK